MPTQPYLGEIMPFGGNFAPVGWFACEGQLLSIDQYSALFSLIGTTYGGDGVTTFRLPDLRGRIPIDAGTGLGLSTHTMGEVSGTESVTLTSANLPSHTHTMAEAATGTAPIPTSRVPAPSLAADHSYGPPTATPGTMSPGIVSTAGSSQSHENTQPYLPVYFCIAVEGIYPSQ